MKNYFIIHGADSNPYKDWFGWLFNKLDAEKEKCMVPQFPTGEEQNYKAWKKILQGYHDAGLINEGTIFICHSLACIFVTRFIVEMRIKITGIIAVSGFNSDTTEPSKANESFLTKDKVIEKISAYVKFYHCVYSDNDNYVSLENMEHFANVVSAKKHVLENSGHLDGESGFKEFPYLWELLDKINTIV